VQHYAVCAKFSNKKQKSRDSFAQNPALTEIHVWILMGYKALCPKIVFVGILL